MIMSRVDIENIAAAVLKNFKQFMFEEHSISGDFLKAPINVMASEYLGLNVIYCYLSSDRSVLGVTAYADTNYAVKQGGRYYTIPIKRNDIFLDESFMLDIRTPWIHTQRRFTLAHECAHQILYQLESDRNQDRLLSMYEAGRNYSIGELKERENWNEWQANALAAALLMPPQVIETVLSRHIRNRKLYDYGGFFSHVDHLRLKQIASDLYVSQTALILRLKQLGYIEERPISEFTD